jgi:hypothetical protein
MLLTDEDERELVNCVRHGRKKALTVFFVRAFLAAWTLKKGSAIFKQGEITAHPRS